MLKFEKEETVIFKFKNLSQLSGIRHFISTNINKKNGILSNDLDISFNTGKDKRIILKNRKILSDAVQIPLEKFVMQNQIHGDTVTIAGMTDKGAGIFDHNDTIQNSDAMITDKKDICLFLFAADCVPVLFYDKKNKVIAAAHSGWKGTVKNITKQTAEKMHKKYHSNYNDILVGIGPAISLTNYEVGQNVVDAVKESFSITDEILQFNKESKKYHFDLKLAIKYQLSELGIPNKNIEISDHCTLERQDLFFSARGKEKTGRFGAGIMLYSE